MATTTETPASTQQPAEATPAKLRDAYVSTSRMRVGGIVARVCAVGLMLGLLGGIGSLQDTSVFDMARNEGPFLTELKKPPFGFFIGPALILILLPIARGRRPRVFFKRSYLPRIVIANLLWIAGLIALIVEVSSLDSRFTIEAGTYIGTALISVGLLATLAMWPAGLEVVQVDKKGRRATPPGA